MKLFINGHNYHYALESLIRVFLPNENIEKIYNESAVTDRCVYTELSGTEEIFIKVRLIFNGYDKEQCASFKEYENRNLKLEISKLLFILLKEATGYTPGWGLQTGVRPTKIYFTLKDRLGSDEAAKIYLRDEMFIEKNKVNLLQSVCSAERKIIDTSDYEQFSLYISVPFCPSRCSYCSFTSHSVESAQKLIPDYVNLLCEELKTTAKTVKRLGLKLRTVYIGGGTPTILTESDLLKIIDTVQSNFSFDALTEFTLEAGRPDTLNFKKLKSIKSMPVTRLTINAQSFNDDVLKAIGRNHSAKDIYAAYENARKLGFDNINTDLIAGLTGESVESFVNSLNCAVALNAENITVHTLALKRSSFLITRDAVSGKAVSDTKFMVDTAQKILTGSSYTPYYLYRQSRSLGNLENTGWCINSKECEYNVFMMEEVQNVFGIGAGAVTRLINKDRTDIKRVYNFKYPFEYIKDFKTIIERKGEAENILLKYLR